MLRRSCRRCPCRNWPPAGDAPMKRPLHISSPAGMPKRSPAKRRVSAPGFSQHRPEEEQQDNPDSVHAGSARGTVTSHKEGGSMVKVHLRIRSRPDAAHGAVRAAFLRVSCRRRPSSRQLLFDRPVPDRRSQPPLRGPDAISNHHLQPYEPVIFDAFSCAAGTLISCGKMTAATITSRHSAPNACNMVTKPPRSYSQATRPTEAPAAVKPMK